MLLCPTNLKTFWCGGDPKGYFTLVKTKRLIFVLKTQKSNLWKRDILFRGGCSKDPKSDPLKDDIWHHHLTDEASVQILLCIYYGNLFSNLKKRKWWYVLINFTTCNCTIRTSCWDINVQKCLSVHNTLSNTL